MSSLRKQGFRITMLFIVSLGAFGITPSAFAQEPAWWTKQKRDCRLPSNLAYNSWDGRCPARESSNNTSNNNSDNGEAARQAEEKRRADEQAEREAEDKRIAEKKKRDDEAAKKRQADFEKTRDEAVQTLRGSGTSTTLRGVDTGGTGIRDSRTGTGIRESSPSSDPMVVDARNVSSGLSKGMDTAIADLYKDAPAGVADRVRKGFQAVMGNYPDHWKDAKAWFQDALNHDPTNIGIKRFVALCDYTYTKSAPVVAKPVVKTPEPPAKMSETDRAAYLKIIGDAQDRILAEDFDKAVYDFNQNFVPKHPELKLPALVQPAKSAPAYNNKIPLETFIRNVKQIILGTPPSKHPAVAAVRG